MVNKIDMPEKEQLLNKDYDSSKEYYQSVVIELDNGKQYVFTGKAFTLDKEDVTIVDIKVSEPKPLPDDTKFASMDWFV